MKIFLLTLCHIAMEAEETKPRENDSKTQKKTEQGRRMFSMALCLLVHFIQGPILLKFGREREKCCLHDPFHHLLLVVFGLVSLLLKRDLKHARETVSVPQSTAASAAGIQATFICGGFFG